MAFGRRIVARVASVALIALAAAAVQVAPGGTAGAATTLPRPEGAGPPVAASGMGTQAALDNPRCRHDDPLYGPYGRFDSTAVGGGPVCVIAWKAGADNGGATAQGVTKDRIKIVIVSPNADQASRDPVPPTALATSTKGTYEDAVYDYLLPQMRFYETWGRDLEVHLFTSTGSDEAAQRADAVAIKAMKPFAVINTISGEDLAVLEADLAGAKILTQGYSASYEDSAKQSPYRWGSADNDGTAINSAEVLGKQLVGKKAEFGGSDVADQTRRIGVVYADGTINYDGFVKAFSKYGGKVTTNGTIPTGPTDAVQAAAPTLIARMKSDGVTTIATFAGYNAMQILMEAASAQDYFPEWFITGAQYQDIGLLMRGYPKDQSPHAFGLSFVAPWVVPEPKPATGLSLSQQLSPYTWYWGLNVATASQRYGGLNWLLSGIQAAGPKLTAPNFKQGLFALPAVGGAATGAVDSATVAYGKTALLPYDEYASTGTDFAPFWWDPNSQGFANGTGTDGQGIGWFLNGAKRYQPTTWPKKPFNWFDKSGAITSFPTRQTPVTYAGDCTGCPSSGGSGSATAPSKTAIVYKAGGTGASAA